MRIKLFYKIILPIIILTFVIFTFQIRNVYNTKKEYPLIKINDEYHGVVTMAKPYQSICYTILDSSKKVMLTLSVNFNYEDSYLNHFIQVGDSISKRSYSDSLFVYRNNQQYLFLLGKYINE